MLAEEFAIIDPEASLWNATRPLLDSALRLEREEKSYAWHGWRKDSIMGSQTSHHDLRGKQEKIVYGIYHSPGMESDFAAASCDCSPSYEPS